MVTNRRDLPQQHYYTPDEYFALEQTGDARYEYWDGEIVCMSGGTREHSLISGNIFFRLRLGLEGRECTPFTSDQAVKTPTLPPYRYPDTSVACGRPLFEKIRNIDALINPMLIVEVLSSTTAVRDYESKFLAYQAIPTFSEYLLVAQEAPHVTHYIRQADGHWVRYDVTDLSASLSLRSVDYALSLQDIYEGVNDLRAL